MALGPKFEIRFIWKITYTKYQFQLKDKWEREMKSFAY